MIMKYGILNEVKIKTGEIAILKFKGIRYWCGAFEGSRVLQTAVSSYTPTACVFSRSCCTAAYLHISSSQPNISEGRHI
jgi:hypothetical protein